MSLFFKLRNIICKNLSIATKSGFFHGEDAAAGMVGVVHPYHCSDGGGSPPQPPPNLSMGARHGGNESHDPAIRTMAGVNDVGFGEGRGRGYDSLANLR